MPMITTVDCERIVPNRFALVQIAAARARALHRGAAPHVSPDDDVPALIALREIAAGTIDLRPIHQLVKQQNRGEREDGPNGSFSPSPHSAGAFGSATDSSGPSASRGRKTSMTVNSKNERRRTCSTESRLA